MRQSGMPLAQLLILAHNPLNPLVFILEMFKIRFQLAFFLFNANQVLGSQMYFLS